MKHTLWFRCFLVVTSAACLTTPLAAFEVETHRLINEQAGQTEELASVLIEDLKLARGIDTVLDGLSAVRWLGVGGIREDDGSLVALVRGTTRYLRHFHDPLEPWDNAGLRLVRLVRQDSSIRWMQRDTQEGEAPGTGNWAWQDARRYYRDALVGDAPGGSTATAREQALARTFRALGQIMHLVVDASVPEHTRNDVHGLPAPYDSYEGWALRTHATVAAEGDFIARYLSSPFTFDPGILRQPTGDARAPVPIARLIDTRLYANWGDPNDTLSTAIGIAEFANANFFSEDTGYARFLHPNYPYPDRGRLRPSQQPAPKTGRVRAYFRKGVLDGLDVDPVLAECVLEEAADGLGVLEPHTIACTDEKVWEQTALAMLPRAVGYARALLDYFFRGRLDVDLFAFADPEGVDPAVVQVRGTNVSDEPLDAGTLRLYADDPAGVRMPLTPASPTADLTVTAAAGAPVVSAPFRMPPDAERVVAVYQGKVGEEAPDPSRNFPGAVIGKVLGGVRVEEIFAEPDTEEGAPGRWMLRTPRGVYPLRGFTTAQYERVTLGDGQDIVLAWTPFTPEQALFRTFAIPRQPGSIEPVLTETPAGPEVVLQPLQETSFPFGREVGPTVAFSDSLDYAQRFGRFEVTSVWATKVINPGEDPQCVYDRTDLGAVTLEPAHTQQVAFNGSFPLLLDVAHNGGFGTTDRPYVWLLRWVGATANGALRALVSIHLTQPEGPVVTVPNFTLNLDGVKEPDGELAVTARFPSSLPVWFLLDLKDGTVLGSTAGAGAQLTLALADTARGFPRVYRRVIEDKSACAGGTKQAGPWAEIRPRLAGEQDPLDLVIPVDTASGTQSFAPDQWLTPELQGLGGFGVGLQFFQTSATLVYACVENAGRTSCGALRQTHVSGQIVPGDALDAALRPGGPQERVVLLAGQGGFGDAERVLLWEPGARTARVLFAPRLLGESGYLIAGATSSAVLVTALGGAPFYLAALDGDPAPRLFERTDGWALALLEPRFLYDAFALKFLRLTELPEGPAPLTALPATLAGGTASNPIGSYHAIRVP
ncbi:MAG: hypothetical protein A3I14_08970 [Candidatus Rokubacteria bacterium RIFCSPLOWO2_02_FULL_73_56]|nr:MAG: hypothetical protein A3D33_00640 [Candidatus Rokubacteria bacterium RIFCSPHIGHO2_02_FULL_73_26]OGL09443.1 MAG: hypothetical protein A3I14_08970 [Candidatus Rokubacteria bacterium RIFCSPLOWO2_02_FULL_73_56]OGL25166.1 MAG: hypothetical protein A3G44_05635 [Candidatus Rokubacteria bacterium RIFCSPLOWO2_12_FULL_73_47]